MKLLAMKYRETQSEFFGKRGMNWHFSAVVHSSDHSNCKPTECEYQIHAYIAVFDSCKQDWFYVCCILEEVLGTVKETHPSVKRAILRSDNAGCYHNSALLSTINSTSKRSGIEVVRYDFSDPLAGKDLCDRRIAPCKQRLRNYVAENNDIQTAQDVKNALESPPSITGTRVAVCTVDPSQMSTKVASNKIPNITKYNNFSFKRDIITVWQAYGIGAGQKIPNSIFTYTQDTSGLRRVGEWSQESIITTQRRQAGAGTKDPLNLVATFPCMEPACIQTFSTLQKADGHMDTGRHVLLQEKKSVYDTIRRRWASIATSVKGQSQKPICSDYQSDAAIAGGLQGTPGEAQLGWALKKTKANVRM
ncbi:uncharacterized protein [Montipora foliosa]|uniref:uncharacterized protein n=1 Tax=Montipora foliosa TaxID=591990 RepID=UPI0035F14CA9